MAIVEVKVPQLSESVAEATLLQWKKKVGEAVAVDEILIDVETDKVVLEVPAHLQRACWLKSWLPMALPSRLIN
jgi:pyruvate/2-oxoglutarate dehydrogenase complex dihydrolipoamide acyltransferase (E2) component